MKEKENIVAEAYHTPGNVKATAKKYLILPTNIRQWKKRIATIKSNVSSKSWENIKLNKQSGAAGMFLHKNIFPQLAQFFENFQAAHRVVTVNMLCAEYKKLSGEEDISNGIVRHRIYRWMAREGICNQQITHQAQNTHHCEIQMKNFVEYINFQIQNLNIKEDNVVNCDETNVDFSIDSSKTLNWKGHQTVAVTQAKSSQQATALLAVTLTGQKLKPYVIFKGNPGPKGRVIKEFTSNRFQYPNSNEYTVQKKAWMDENTMLHWIKTVWKPWCEGRGTTYLILDEFTAHMTEDVRRAFDETGTIVDFIISGYTSKLQPLDVGINKPFKYHLRKCFKQFMIRNNGDIPHHMEVATWVECAWHAITEQSILNTWRHIGIGSFQQNHVNNNNENDSNDTVEVGAIFFLKEKKCMIPIGP